MESKAWTEKLGVFQCFQKIHNMVQDKTGDNLMDDVIDNILRSRKIELQEPHASIVEKAICDYVEEIFQKLRDHEYNEADEGLLHGWWSKTGRAVWEL